MAAVTRYFEGDHPSLVSRLEDHFARVRSGFEEMGWSGALVLGGGYGRGEGGVMLDGDEPGFSNDLDYFLFDADPDSPALTEWCRRVEKVESPRLGIDVEIKCLRPESIGDPGKSMMFADLVAGHVVVAGDAGFLGAMRAGLDFARIDASEATRLLWNRGSGMFYARCRMGQEDSRGFVIRNHAKLKLALGDAWLCLHGKYTSECRERGRRLAGIPLPGDAAKILAWHAEGVEFKFRPFSKGPSWEELRAESVDLVAAWKEVYLAAEARRLGMELKDFTGYLSLPRILRDSGLMRNLALALRDRFKRGACLRPVGDYPRAALMRALPCLLGLTPGGIADAAKFLPSPQDEVSELKSWETVYQKWWSYYA
ncbi:MAG: hypothetical protein MUF31_09970 [Akkermansiaceae bacterium]|jgi:hypothetical protein|nr:hypothetical protein [Akkermansiaceae bacterium]